MDLPVSGSTLGIAVSALTSLVVTLVLANYSARIKFKSQIDEGLVVKREQAYVTLWRLTSAIPTWPRADELSYDDLGPLSRTLRDWYFSTGGIYLSREAREAYGDLQQKLNTVSAHIGVLSDADYERIRKAASALRSELTCDLFSRTRARG